MKSIWITLFITTFLIILEFILIFFFQLLRIPQGSNLGLKLPASPLEVSFFMFLVVPIICVVGPILETFIFQYLFYEGLCVKYKYDNKLFIFLSALIFGLMHFSFLSSILLTFTICVAFNYTYVLLRELKNKNAFLIILSVHSLLNIITIILNYLPDYLGRLK